MDKEKSSTKKRIISSGLLIFLLFITIVSAKTVSNLSSPEHLKSVLSDSIKSDINDYAKSYMGSTDMSDTLAANTQAVSTLSSSVVNNLTDEQIKQIAKLVSEYTAGFVSSNILDGSGTLDTDALMKSIQDILNNKLSGSLSDADITALKEAILSELGSDIDSSVNDAIDKALADLQSNMTINGAEKDSYLKSLKVELLNYVKNSSALNGTDGTDGKTPVSGTDYFTDSDINDIIQKVENSIMLSGDLVVTGLDGTDGKTAYELACDGGFVGTEEEWLASLKAYQPVRGTDYYTDDDIETFEAEIQTLVLTSIDDALETLNGYDLTGSFDNINASIDELAAKQALLESGITNAEGKFNAGVSIIAQAITEEGVETASTASPATISTNIHTLATKKYNTGAASKTMGVTSFSMSYQDNEASSVTQSYYIGTGKTQVYAGATSMSNSCNTSGGANGGSLSYSYNSSTGYVTLTFAAGGRWTYRTCSCSGSILYV